MAGGGVGGWLARCHLGRRLHTVILVPASSYSSRCSSSTPMPSSHGVAAGRGAGAGRSATCAAHSGARVLWQFPPTVLMQPLKEAAAGDQAPPPHSAGREQQLLQAVALRSTR